MGIIKKTRELVDRSAELLDEGDGFGVAARRDVAGQEDPT